MKLWGRLLVVSLVAVLSAPAVPASAAEPSVTGYTSKTVYVAGETATINVTVHDVGPSTHLKVVARFANGSSKVLDNTDVNADPGQTYAHKHYKLFMYYDSKVDVYVAGATSPDKTFNLPVRAAVASTILGYFQQSGSYAVFPRGSQPSFRSNTTPPRKYRCLKHEVWRAYSSGWKVVHLSACKVENDSGAVSWQWTGSHPSGIRFRVRARFFGDSLNHSNSGKFIYFKFR